jgi:YceI-like domain
LKVQVVRVDAAAAECLVFTFKEGLLSAVAHDLKIRVTKFAIEGDEQTRTFDARFDARSLRVVCAMNDGVESRGTLSTANKREIEGNIVRDVLEAEQYPEIHFVAASIDEKGDGYVVKGALTLHGKRRQITVRVQRDGDRYVAEARIHQPDFGIRPYSAMFGTLRVQADLTVRVSVPIPSTVGV